MIENALKTERIVNNVFSFQFQCLSSFFFLAAAMAINVDSFKEAPTSKILHGTSAFSTEETHQNKKLYNKGILTQKDIGVNELENSKKSPQLKNGGRRRSVKRRMRNVFVKHIPRMIHLNQVNKKKSPDYEKNKK